MEFGLKKMPDPSRVQKNPFYEDINKERIFHCGAL